MRAAFLLHLRRPKKDLSCSAKLGLGLSGALERHLLLSKAPMLASPQRVCDRIFMLRAERHFAQLCRSAKRLARNDHHAEDLVQETLLRAWQHRDALAEHENPGAWMGRVLRNAFLEELRHRRREDITPEPWEGGPSEVALPADGDTAGESRCPSVEPENLRIHVNQLPACYREVVKLVDLDGCSYREAAQRLQCPLGTVMSRLSRGRAKLRSNVEAHTDASTRLSERGQAA